MEELVTAVTTVRLDNADILALGMLFYRVARVAEQHAWLDKLDGLLEALSRGFHHTDGIWIRLGLVSDVVRLVKIAVEASVI